MCLCRLLSITGSQMVGKRRIHELLNEAAFEILNFIKEYEGAFSERWIPDTFIRNQLDLNIAPYQKKGIISCYAGCFFAVLMRVLEERNLVEYQIRNNLIFYRSKQQDEESQGGCF